jgi:hypothetical protein
MHARLALRSLLAVTALAAIAAGGCSTAQVAALPPIPPPAPDYVKVPHPEGMDLGDLMAVFTERDAPAPESLKDCDADWKKLSGLTRSRDERAMGLRELVRRDPVKYHWCFYGKLLELERSLQAEAYIDEKQKQVLATFSFATPVAHAFNDEFRDSRYLRWAIARYRRLSEYVFYRKLELTPLMASELGGTMNPWGMLRPQKDTPASILEKYGMLKPPHTDEQGRPAGPVEGPAARTAAAGGAGMAIPEAETPDAMDERAVDSAESAAEPAASRAPAAVGVPTAVGAPVAVDASAVPPSPADQPPPMSELDSLPTQ